MTDFSQTHLDVEFDKTLFSKDAIKKAAYRLTNRLSIELRDEADKYICGLYLKPGITDSLEELVGILRNEVLDQSLREEISAKTETTRNLILAHTFSNSGLTNE